MQNAFDPVAELRSARADLRAINMHRMAGEDVVDAKLALERRLAGIIRRLETLLEELTVPEHPDTRKKPVTGRRQVTVAHVIHVERRR